MANYLCVSLRFIAGVFHGRGASDNAEWPPAPLRLFQSLVAVAATKSRQSEMGQSAVALKWLESLEPPIIYAPPVHIGIPVRTAVPNNDLDIVASAWAKRKEPTKQPNELKTMKTIRSTWLLGDDGVHYLWPLSHGFNDQVQAHLKTVSSIARSLFALGWAMDVVVGNCHILEDDQLSSLTGHRWVAGGRGGENALRVPKPGTLDELIDRHKQFLGRLGPDGFAEPDPLSCYATINYRRATDPPSRPLAAFSLLKTDGSAFRPFNTVRCALTVAGMVRHAAARAAQDAGWEEDRINSFVLGHGRWTTEGKHLPVGPSRLAYVPLPSVEPRGERDTRIVNSIRRIAVCCFADGTESEMSWIRQAVSGQELVDRDSGQPVALLSLIPTSDRVVRRYTKPAASWATVTPFILPGYDDPAHYRRRMEKGTTAEEQRLLLHRLHERIDELIRKAITQAGFSSVLAKHAEIEWRKTGFLAGVEFADRYGVPDHLRRYPRYHLTIRWRDEAGRPIKLPGPICLGGGRYYGLGLFMADD